MTDCTDGHEWTINMNGAICMNLDCDKTLDYDEAEAMLNEHAALKRVLWKCRHGGKGGIPVDYQQEVDVLLRGHTGE